MEKNRRFWLIKYIFNKQFLAYIQEIFNQYKPTVDLNYNEAKQLSLQPAILRSNNARDELEILKFQVSFVLTVAIRA
jgi:hypothetical protein